MYLPWVDRHIIGEYLDKKNGFLPVHFETNILRCETAALYGIAVMQSLVLRKNECQ